MQSPPFRQTGVALVAVGPIRGVAAVFTCEVARLWALLVANSRHRRLRGYLLAIVLGVAITSAWLLEHTSSGHHGIAVCCGERVGEPLWTGLLRLPGSLIAPAPLLPVWGAVLQVLLAFGVSEAAVGRARTLAVAGIAHVIATLAGRFFVWLGPAHFGGLSPSWLHAIDTGPSAATVGLVTYLTVVLRCPFVGGLITAGVIADFVARPDLAGREHMVAIVVGVLCAGAQLWSLHRAADRATTEQAESVRPTDATTAIG